MVADNALHLEDWLGTSLQGTARADDVSDSTAPRDVLSGPPLPRSLTLSTNGQMPSLAGFELVPPTRPCEEFLRIETDNCLRR
jgi:hypothetical protein